MRKLGLLTLATAMLCYAAAPVLAQETKGSIEGTVKDATGGALPGATVDVKSAATAAQSTVTDSNGFFRFPTLQPGVYSVIATLQGFSPLTRDKIQLNAGAQLKVELMLNVSGRSESVNVKAQTPIVDVKQNAVNTTISSEIIDLIPKDRSFLSALVGIAGVGQEDRGGGIMIDGAGASENRIIIDGMDTTNLQNGTVGKDVVVDFIDQIQVKQSGYAAEYRATTGGVISAITKSGSNQFHGEGGSYLSGKALVGLRGAVRPSLTTVTPDATKPKERIAVYNQPSRTASEFETTTLNPIFSMSGPIFKNKMWFFTGYDPAVTLQSRQVQWQDANCLNVTADNTGTETTCRLSSGLIVPRTQQFDAKSRNWQLSYNSTIQLTRSIRTRLTGTDQRSTGALGTPAISSDTFNQNGFSVSTSNPASFNPRPTTYTAGFNDSWSGTVDWVMNNKTYANVTSGFLNYGSGSKGGDFYHGIRRSFSGNNFPSANVLFADIPVELQHGNAFTDNPSNSFNVKNNYNRYTLNGDITRYADWHGQHALKTGVQWERFGNSLNSGQQYPLVTLFWGATRTTLDQRQVTGKYGYYTVGQQWSIGEIHSNNAGLFLQDQWTFNNKLTLNYGLRADRTNIPSYKSTAPGLTFNWASKVAPRLGFAYDVRGDAKWKAYGSWGVFYDIEKLELPRGAWGGETWNNYYYTLDDFDWTKINCQGPDGTGCPGTYIEQNDLRHVSNDPNDPSHNTVDPNLKPYKAEELVFGLDHELNRLMSLGVRYAHKWIDRGIEDVGISVPGIGELFYIANPGYGLGAYPYGPSYPRSPFPVRHYDGVDVNWRRRIQNNCRSPRP